MVTKRARPGATTTPPSVGRITMHRSLADMSADDLRAWLEGLQSRLVAKQQRERAYLDRRAKRGTHTPTDDAYEEDQRLEDELLALLDELLHNLPLIAP
jgi:hypothetical protein